MDGSIGIVIQEMDHRREPGAGHDAFARGANVGAQRMEVGPRPLVHLGWFEVGTQHLAHPHPVTLRPAPVLDGRRRVRRCRAGRWRTRRTRRWPRPRRRGLLRRVWVAMPRWWPLPRRVCRTVVAGPGVGLVGRSEDLTTSCHLALLSAPSRRWREGRRGPGGSVRKRASMFSHVSVELRGIRSKVLRSVLDGAAMARSVRCHSPESWASNDVVNRSVMKSRASRSLSPVTGSVATSASPRRTCSAWASNPSWREVGEQVVEPGDAACEVAAHGSSAACSSMYRSANAKIGEVPVMRRSVDRWWRSVFGRAPSIALETRWMVSTMATLAEIAEHAGVGIGTVSRVFNGSASVSDQMRARVLQSATQLGYDPGRPRACSAGNSSGDSSGCWSRSSTNRRLCSASAAAGPARRPTTCTSCCTTSNRPVRPAACSWNFHGRRRWKRSS